MTPREVFVCVVVASFVWPIGSTFGRWVVDNTNSVLSSFVMVRLLRWKHGATIAEIEAHTLRIAMFVNGNGRPLGMPACAPRCGVCTHLGCFDPGPFVGMVPGPIVAMPPPPPPDPPPPPPADGAAPHG